METAVKTARTTSERTASAVDSIDATRSTPTPALPPIPCTSPMPNAPTACAPHGRGRAPPRGVRVQVGVSLAAVGVCVDVEPAAAPPAEQAYGEGDDRDGDGRLGEVLHRRGQILAEDEDRKPEREEREPVTDAPRQAEPCGGGAGPPVRAGDERRHGGEVIGVGRMAKAEQDPDEQNEPDRGAVRERGPVVDAEHPGILSYVIEGSERTVIARPSAMMTRALTAGRARTSRPSKLIRLNARRAPTARRPIPVTVAARPRLNPTISARPNRRGGARSRRAGRRAL